jgi:tellurium resistance protein TerZ
MTFIFKKNGEKYIDELGGASPVIVFAIGWENKGKAGFLGKMIGVRHEADLDLSCAVYDQYQDRVDCVWYAQLASKDGAIRHGGDDTVGWDEGDGADDELVIIDLNQLDPEVQTLMFVISCFAGRDLSLVEKAHWRLFDAQTKREIARYDFGGAENATAKVVMRLQKEINKGLTTWKIKALDEPATGQNIQEVFPEIRALLES